MKPHPKPRAPLPKPPTPPAKPTHWNEVAQWYDDLAGDHGTPFQQQVIFPGVLRLLGLPHSPQPPKPLRILDLACGQGALCRKLAAAGCDLLGVDAAPALIEAARQRTLPAPSPPIHYLVASATRLPISGTGVSPVVAPSNAGVPPPALAPASFDAITLILAVQNISPLSPMWKACHTLLKPAGSLIIVMMHPCFRIPQHSDWHWDSSKNLHSRTIAQYLTSSRIEIQTHPGRAAHGQSTPSTPHFHRPLQAYINTLASSGLLVDHMDEWPSPKKSQPGPKQAEMDRSRGEIPMFLALRAKRGSAVLEGRDS